MKKSLKICLTTILFIAGSCTTAIIDEGSVSELPPIDRVVTYQSDVKSVMDNFCITCHGGPAPQAELDLTNYTNTRNAALNQNLVSRMNNQAAPMPPNGLLSPQIRQLIDKWVEDGLLESQ